MEITFNIFFFVLGASLASFLNVLVFEEKSVKKALERKRSRCISCKKDLLWWELIPVFSWIFLLGKCSKCKKSIPFYHPVSELFLGLMFLFTFSIFGLNVFLLYGYLLFVVVTYFLSMYDIEKGIVPNRWILPVIGICLITIIGIGFTQESFITFVGSRILSAIGYSIFFVLMNGWSMSGLMPGVSKGKQGFGWGDAKFAPFIGLILGPINTILSGWIGVFSGALIGIILMVKSRIKDKPKAGPPLADTRIPYIPFMTFGAWCALLWGDVIVEFIRNVYVL